MVTTLPNFGNGDLASDYMLYSSANLAAMAVGATAQFVTELPAECFSMRGFYGLEIAPLGNVNNGTFSMDIETFTRVAHDVAMFGDAPSGLAPQWRFRVLGTLACMCGNITGTSGSFPVPNTLFLCDTQVWTETAGFGAPLADYTGFDPAVSTPGGDASGNFMIRDMASVTHVRLRLHTYAASNTAANALVRLLTR